jgi:hypothetical protein
MPQETLQALRDLKNFKQTPDCINQYTQEIDAFIKSVIDKMDEPLKSAAKVAILDDNTVLNDLLPKKDMIKGAMQYLTQEEVDKYLETNQSDELRTFSDSVEKFKLEPIPIGDKVPDEKYLRDTAAESQKSFLVNRDKNKGKPVAVITVSLNEKDELIKRGTINAYKAQAKQMQYIGYEVVICLVDDKGSLSTVSDINKQTKALGIGQEIHYLSINGHGTKKQVGKQGIEQGFKIDGMVVGAKIALFACFVAGQEDGGIARNFFEANPNTTVFGAIDQVNISYIDVEIGNDLPKITGVTHHASNLADVIGRVIENVDSKMQKYQPNEHSALTNHPEKNRYQLYNKILKGRNIKIGTIPPESKNNNPTESKNVFEAAAQMWKNGLKIVPMQAKLMLNQRQLLEIKKKSRDQ